MISNPQTEIIAIEYGKSIIPESMVFKNGREDIQEPIVFMIYLIKTDNRTILVDAGCETMPGFVMTDFIGTVNALKRHGISPNDVTDLVITHAHHDHIECSKYFTDAKVYIQKDEYEAGRDYLAHNNNIHIFGDDVSVTPNIKVVKIGGHSVGSCIVVVDGSPKPYVIAGDECYKRACIEKHISTGVTACPQKSMKFLDDYTTDKYNILLCHEK